MPRIISKPTGRDRFTLIKTDTLEAFSRGAGLRSDLVLYHNQLHAINMGAWSLSVDAIPMDPSASPEDIEQLNSVFTTERRLATAADLALINRVKADKLNPFSNGSIDQTSEGFGAFETIGIYRSTQEDALAWQTFDNNELDGLSPEEIGNHLRTTYKVLDDAADIKALEGGTTASTTVVQGEHIITATLADASAFIVLYNAANQVLHVERLNHRTHNPNLEEEKARITEAGGSVEYGRVEGVINVSRAIGDHGIRGATGAKLVVADADIDITSISEIAQRNSIDPASCKVQIITTCDGYTDPASKGSDNSAEEKHAHEVYLRAHLEAILLKNPDADEAEIAAVLSEMALIAQSTDNISVAVQTIQRPGRPATFQGMIGVYDGHAGAYAAHYVASQIGDEFIKQCRLSPAVFSAQERSSPFIQAHASAVPSTVTEAAAYQSREPSTATEAAAHASPVPSIATQAAAHASPALSIATQAAAYESGEPSTATEAAAHASPVPSIATVASYYVSRAPRAATIVATVTGPVLNIQEKPSLPLPTNRIAIILLNFGLATAELAIIAGGLVISGFLVSPIGMSITLGLLATATAVGLTTAVCSKLAMANNNRPLKTSTAMKAGSESASTIDKDFEAGKPQSPAPVRQHYPSLFAPKKPRSNDLEENITVNAMRR